MTHAVTNRLARLLSLCVGHTTRMGTNALEPVIASLTFSPWQGVDEASCRNCEHAAGWLEWLICGRSGMAPNGYACHAWQRAPGADDR